VLKSIRERKPDYKRFVEPQRGQADVLVQFGWSRIGGADGLKVKLYQKNQQPVAKRIRFNGSGPKHVLRGERRRDGSGVVTLDGKVPQRALGRMSRLIQRATGVRPQVERRSATLDAARTIVAGRVIKEIARAGRRSPRAMARAR
jgi:hypothetical protein